MESFDEKIGPLLIELQGLKNSRRDRILGILRAHQALNGNGVIKEMTGKIDALERQIKTFRESADELAQMERLVELEERKEEIDAKTASLGEKIQKIRKEISEYRKSMPEAEVKLMEVFGLRGHKELGPLCSKVECLQNQTIECISVLKDINKQVRNLSGNNI